MTIGTFLPRLLAGFERRGDDECWPWKTAAPDEYGRIRNGEKQLKAHVAMFEYFHGPVPPGHIVRHTCDYRPCCNPYHLVSGTKADNLRDMAERGRARNMHTVLTLGRVDHVAL